MLKLSFQQVKNWFNNNGRKRNARAVFTHGRKYSTERVVGQLYKDKVIAATARLSGKTGGDTAFLPKWWEGCKEVYAGLSDNEQEEVQRLVQEWSRTGPPMDVRRKRVPAHVLLHCN